MCRSFDQVYLKCPPLIEKFTLDHNAVLCTSHVGRSTDAGDTAEQTIESQSTEAQQAA